MSVTLQTLSLYCWSTLKLLDADSRGRVAGSWLGGTYQGGRATPSQGAIQVGCHFGVGNGGPGDDVALVGAAVH